MGNDVQSFRTQVVGSTFHTRTRENFRIVYWNVFHLKYLGL